MTNKETIQIVLDFHTTKDGWRMEYDRNQEHVEAFTTFLRHLATTIQNETIDSIVLGMRKNDRGVLAQEVLNYLGGQP
tara:strand:+ start:245 stop:478 length:234 start_codon:yes stop_codon:yes gene_type:complete